MHRALKTSRTNAGERSRTNAGERSVHLYMYRTRKKCVQKSLRRTELIS